MHSNIIKYHKVSFTPEDLTVLPQMQFPQVQVRNTCASELRIDDAVPFTTTPNHRIMVPSDGDDATVTAVDLKLGNWVMCSDRVAKKVVGMRLIPAAGLPEDFRVGLLFSHDSAMQASSILVLGGLSYTGFDHN
jgi:hypothetical protein